MSNTIGIVNARNITDKEFFYGHKACAGCGGSIVVRLVLKVLGERTFTVIPAGCMSAVGFVYPQLCFATNAIISTFAGTASMLSALRREQKRWGLRTITLWNRRRRRDCGHRYSGFVGSHRQKG